MTLIQNLKNQLHLKVLDHMDLRKIAMEDLQKKVLQPRIRALLTSFIPKLCSSVEGINLEKILTEVENEILGLGPLENLLKDDTISEIMINGHDHIYIEQRGKLVLSGESFSNESSLRNTINRIIAPLGRRIDESSPMVDARLTDGSRFNAIIPPLSLKGSTVTIRKFFKTAFGVEKMIEGGSISPLAADFLQFCVQERKNILVAGGTGSGKTTLLNALSGFIPSEHRIVTIEDAAELKLHQHHVITLEARPANLEGKGNISIRDLVKNALRMRPDRIIVGECRGPETLDMLQAMNTGHEGSMTTLHANTPRDALARTETLVMMAGYDLPLRAIREQISSAIDLIVFISRRSDGSRKLTHITEVCGLEKDTFVLQDLFEFDPIESTLKFQKRTPEFLQFSPHKALYTSMITKHGKIG